MYENKMSIKSVVIFISFTVISKNNITDNEDIDDMEEMETVNMTSEEKLFGITTENELDEDNYDWINGATLDVAFYLRSHKFNNFDRRYKNKLISELSLNHQFPVPPLRILHWEVEKYCSVGFLSCLKYLHETIGLSELQREKDTRVIMKSNKWIRNEDEKNIKIVNEECKKLFKIDYERPDPFRNSLERFQWATTASYFMCWFTMQEHPSLAVFEEPCDNLANCLEYDNYIDFVSDPRSNNNLPYQCALYSFCPDPCCPIRKIIHHELCIDIPENPCRRDELKTWSCTFDRKKNMDFISLILNKWNYTCKCNEPNRMEWVTKYGMCLDLDECEMSENTCDPILQNCINKNGTYYCVCKAGFIWNATTNACSQNMELEEGIRQLNSPKRKYKSIWQDEKGFSIIRGILRYFQDDEI